MSNFQVDLSNCDREPIHIPGQIQSHGFLLVLDRYSHVTHYSDNIYDFIPSLTRELLDCSLNHLESYIGISYQPHFLKNLIASSIDKPSFEKTNPVPVEIGGNQYLLIISRSKDFFLLEFEKASSVFELGVQHILGKSIAKILSHKRIDKLLSQTADEVKEIIEFDRVMVYQFMPDGHGVVVAESKNEKSGSMAWAALSCIRHSKASARALQS